MNQLRDIRQRDDGSYEILAQVEYMRRDEAGNEAHTVYEQWEPLATFIVNSRTLGGFFIPGAPTHMSIHELLLSEGWTPPDG